MGNPSHLARVCVLVGVAAILVASWLNRPGHWRPLVMSTAVSESSIEVSLQPGTEYEIALEAGRSVDPEVLAAVSAPAPQTAVSGEWTASCDGTTLASGGTEEYLRVLGIRATLGKVRRVLGRVPFGQDEVSYHTFGLAGEFLSERTVGRWLVPAESAGNCEVVWKTANTVDGIRVAVRPSYDEWTPHYGAVAILAFGGVLLAVCGAALGFLILMLRRFSRGSSDSTSH